MIDAILILIRCCRHKLLSMQKELRAKSAVQRRQAYHKQLMDKRHSLLGHRHCDGGRQVLFISFVWSIPQSLSTLIVQLTYMKCMYVCTYVRMYVYVFILSDLRKLKDVWSLPKITDKKWKDVKFLIKMFIVYSK